MDDTSSFPTSLDADANLLDAKNAASTTLDGAITTTDGAGDITVVSTASFPTAGFFTVDSEIIYYSGKTSTTFTGIQRAQQNTSGATHSNGATVDYFDTRHHHNVLKNAILTLEAKVGINSSAVVTSLDYIIRNLDNTNVVNRTRSFFVPAAAFTPLANATHTTDGGGAAEGVACYQSTAANTDTRILTTISIPNDLASGFGFYMLYGPTAAGSGETIAGVGVATKKYNSGSEIWDSLVGPVYGSTKANPVANAVYKSSRLDWSGSISTSDKGVPFSVQFLWWANHASDTYDDKMRFYGLIVDYTADM